MAPTRDPNRSSAPWFSAWCAAVCLAVALAVLHPGEEAVAANAHSLVFVEAPALPTTSVKATKGSRRGKYKQTRRKRTVIYKIRANGDPSICYSLEVSNPTSEAGTVLLNFDLPIAALGPNTVRETLDIDLVDTDGDGMASMIHRAGFTEFQRAYVLEEPNTSTFLGVNLGTQDLTAPGKYSYEAGFGTPVQGPTAPVGGKTVHITTFLLSAGDSALVRGKIVQDDGSGAEECEIPGPDFFTGCSDPNAILGGAKGSVLLGTPGDDIICGGDGDDRIDGGGGHDRIFGGGGNDVISGGAGRDQIHGEEGDDVLCGDDFVGTPGPDVGIRASACTGAHDGAAFKDEIWGDDGDDAIGGGSARDTIRGGLGDDQLTGGSGDDSLFGEEGHDRVAGSSGDDVVRGGPDADQLLGGGGDDKLLADDGVADTSIDGDAGDDSARIDAGVDLTVTGVETFLP